MNADLKLYDTRLVLQGDIVTSEAHDFRLDSPERRSAGSSPDVPRRAMVHLKWKTPFGKETDGLVLNFDGDYPAGVTIVGDLQFWAPKGGKVVLYSNSVNAAGEIHPVFLDQVSLLAEISTLRAMVALLRRDLDNHIKGSP
jgi:hypothetical protein